MSETLQQLSSLGAGLTAYAGLPVLLWTVFAIIVLCALQYWSRSIHIEYHYHIRLSLILALPVGLVALGVTDLIGEWLTDDSKTAAIKLIIVHAPIEMNLAETTMTSASASVTPLLYRSAFWYGTMMIIIMSGSIVFFLKMLCQYFQLINLRRNLTLQPVCSIQGISASNRALAQQCGCSVQVAFSQQPVIPLTFGLRQPVILLPALLNVSPEKMNLVLRHELIHIKNRDYQTHLLITILLIIFWIHPLLHLLYRQLILYREMRCDQQVLDGESVSRKKYASVLLDYLTFPNLDKNVSVNMARRSSNLKKRIFMISSNNTKSTPCKLGSALFSGVILISSLFMACTDLQPQQELDLSSSEQHSEDTGYYTMADEMPELTEGIQAVQRSIRYPQEARRAGIEGHVHIRFIVNQHGEVEDEQIIRGAGGALDEEALRVAKDLEFRPGIQNGEPVRVQYSLPIHFFLMGPEQTDPPELDIQEVDSDIAGLDPLVVIGYTGEANSRREISANP